MTDQEFHELIEFLEETPEMVRRLRVNLSERDLRWKPSEGEFSILEQVCHLRDLEREGYTVRVKKLLTENKPSLPDFDGGRFARERDYNSQDFETALQDFAVARKENTNVAGTLSSDQLKLSGVLEGVGEITLGKLFTLMREHDEYHREEISDLKARLSGQHTLQSEKRAALKSSAALFE
jgi:hypothetical protein